MALLLCACGGTLSDEQRKKIRQEMERHEIRRVTEPEITSAAFEKGRSLMTAIESFRSDSARIDSMIKAENGRLRFLVPGQPDATGIEQQLIDAYIAAESGQPQDNVQMMRNAEGPTDSILYTRPVLMRQPDGVERLMGVWNVWLSKKQLILSMDKD